MVPRVECCAGTGAEPRTTIAHPFLAQNCLRTVQRSRIGASGCLQAHFDHIEREPAHAVFMSCQSGSVLVSGCFVARPHPLAMFALPLRAPATSEKPTLCWATL